MHRHPWVGRAVRRVEDPPLLTGEGEFLADLSQPGPLHAVFVRSPVAHARFQGLDGQGHETSLGQVVADALGVDLADVVVLHGDTAIAPYGRGTGASRSAVVGTGTCMLAAHDVRAKLLRVAGALLEVAPDDLELRGSGV